MTDTLAVVETDLEVHTVARNGLPNRAVLAATIRWDPQDPWAVTLHVEGCPVWVFGWELLAAVTSHRGQAGCEHGDIRMWRVGRQIQIQLRTHDGTAHLSVDARDLLAFTAAVRPRQPVAAVRAIAGSHLALRALLDGPR